MKRNAFSWVVLLFALVASSPAFAMLIPYTATLNGASEFPPNASPGTGTALVDMDTTFHTMRVQVTFSGLLGNTTSAHIHAPTAAPFAGTVGIATPPTFLGFPFGVTAGTYDQTFDLTLASSYSSSFITNFGGGTTPGAEAALLQAMADGKAYFDIHTSQFTGGEIRGFLAPVPIPSTLLLLGSGLVGLVGVGKWRMKK